MDYIAATIFGLIQGITEFLPISSSGHLIILHDFLSLPVQDEFVFDVTLHLATIFAVIYFFRTDILDLFKAWSRSLVGKKSDLGKTSWFIIMATIPAAIAGALFEETIESALRSVFVVIVMLIVVGIFFIVVEKLARKTDDISNLKWMKALAIGFGQSLALIPGTSRSGITIVAGLGLGLKRSEAVKFSFLLSIPIILGATIKKIPQIIEKGINSEEIFVYIVGFLAAYLSGFFTIKYFLKFARNRKLNIFAYYRFALAFLLLIYIIFIK